MRQLTAPSPKSSNGPLGRYVFGPNGDEPLMWYYSGDLATPRWLYADEKGSVIATADASGAVLAIDSYNEYGINGAAHYSQFGYTGQHWIPEAGLYDDKARMYSPPLGRFMQTDPIGYGDGINIYNYTHSDPVNRTDPSGMCSDIQAPCLEDQIIVTAGSGGSGLFGRQGSIDGLELSITVFNVPNVTTVVAVPLNKAIDQIVVQARINRELAGVKIDWKLRCFFKQ